MRFLVGLVFFGLIACDPDTPKTSKQTIPEKDHVIAPDSVHLFYGVSPTMVVDTTMKPVDSVITKNYQLVYHFSVADTLLESASITISCPNVSIFRETLSNVREHLLRFAHSSSGSGSFQTWVLPFNGRPIVEIDLFIDKMNRTLSLELYWRQNI